MSAPGRYRLPRLRTGAAAALLLAIPLVLTASPAPPASASEQASLRWSVVDTAGRSVGGSVFQLWGPRDGSSAGNGDGGDRASALTATVVDNVGQSDYVGLDEDPEPGGFLVTRIVGDGDGRGEEVAVGAVYRSVPITAPGFLVGDAAPWTDLAGSVEAEPVVVTLLPETEDPKPSARAGGTALQANGVGPQAEVTFVCDVGVVYSLERQNGSNRLRQVNMADGATAWGGAFPSAVTNGLAFTADGTQAYALRQDSTSDTTIYRLAAGAATGTTVVPQGSANGKISTSGGVSLVGGAISPLNGLYYFGGYSKQRVGGTDRAVFELHAYNPATNQYVGRVARVVIAGSSFQSALGYTESGGNGDIAFDAQGNLYLVWSSSGISLTNGTVLIPPGQLNRLVRLNAANVPDVTLSGTGTIDSALLTNLPAESDALPYNGVTFDGAGVLYVQTANGTTGPTRIKPINPNTGATIAPPGARTLNGFIGTDLGSCSYPPTIRLDKNVVDRVATGDQFGLRISAGGSDVASATTDGPATGVQSESAGPAIAVVGTQYTISELAAGTTSLSNYATSYVCRWGSEEAAFAQGTLTGASRSAILPAIPAERAGQALVCTLTNTPIWPGIARWAKSDRTSAALLSGSQWTLTGPTGAASTVRTVDDCVAASAAACTGPDKDYRAGQFEIHGLPNGEYTLVETVAPPGYVLDPTSRRMTISNGGVVDFQNIPNTRASGTVVWQKTDTSTPAQHLSGSEWRIVGPSPATTALAVSDCVAASDGACTGADRDARA